MASVFLGVVAVTNFLLGCAWAALMWMAIRASFDSLGYRNGYPVVAVIGVALAVFCFWSAWGLLYARRRAWIASQIIGLFLLALSLAWVATIMGHPSIEFGVNATMMIGGAAFALVYLALLNASSVRKVFK